MMRTALVFLFSLCLTPLVSTSAGAETRPAVKADMRTYTCGDIMGLVKSEDPQNAWPASVILYWTAGYNSTPEQVAVLDFKVLHKAFDDLLKYCNTNSDTRPQEAADQFLGSSMPPPGPDAIKVGNENCALFNAMQDELMEGPGQIVQWLAGSMAKGSQRKIVNTKALDNLYLNMLGYCKKHPGDGVVSVGKKLLAKAP